MSDEKYHDYWLALGQFVHEFAVIELFMGLLLMQVSGVKPPIAAAVFSGVRADAARNLINRALDAAKNEAQKQRLEHVFAQLGHMTEARNDILHCGAFEHHNNEFIVNKIAHIPEREEIYAVTVDTLEALITDARKVQHHLMFETSGEASELLTNDARFRGVLAASWLYKPPQQDARDRRNTVGPRLRRLRAPASRK
jgi:hypothetical protein